MGVQSELCVGQMSKNKGGRPSLYSMELVDAIASRLATGEPMAVICRDDGMPAYRTVKDWIDTKPDVSAAIARARELGYDEIASDCMVIADDSRNDYIEGLAESGDERAVIARANAEAVQRSKLRIDTRLKLLAKWDPKRYGDKVQLANHEGGELPAPTFIIQPVRAAGSE